VSGVGQCPGCGNPLEFRVATSLVAVCPFCQQVVARGDATVEDLGKSNPVLSVPSAFSIGTTGAIKGRHFVVVGRCQLKHALGGVWNEWYAQLDNNKWAWIAEHQGRIAILGEVSAVQAPDIRSLDAATPGSRWLSGRGEFTVAERGIATVHAEEGELPWRAAPHERRAYVDLSAAGGVFGTLDFGLVDADDRPQGPRKFFVGYDVSIEHLALQKPASAQDAAPASLPVVEGARAVNCPRCSAPLELKRPGDTMTIVCGSCGSALSVDEKKDLGFLFAQTLSTQPRIPLGARARFDAQLLKNARPIDRKPLDVEVVAFVVRSVIEDGDTYFFYEYLLSTATDGFRWLVESDGDWLLFKPINTGDVVDNMSTATYQGAQYGRTANSAPKVEQVMGELFWRVTKGDRSHAVDYQRGSQRLSVERTANEVNWTAGFNVLASDLQRVFGVKLPRTSTSMGSAYGSSDYSATSGFSAGGHNEVTLGQAVAIVIVCIVVLFFFVPMCGALGGGGGGHGSYGGGGGSSFGK
jgi:hypothetical protein